MPTVVQRVQDGVRTRDVGCQSDSAETRDTGVQVDLLTQHLSWSLTGEPGGGAVLQQGHLLCLLCPAPHHTPLPTMPLVAPPPAPPPHLWSTELHQAASLPIMLQCEALPPPPPGLIAPLSPCLAEEEQEEQEEHTHALPAANHSRASGGRKRGTPRGEEEEEERARPKKRRGAEEQKEQELTLTQEEVKEAIKHVKTEEEQEVQQEAEGRSEEQSAANHSAATGASKVNQSEVGGDVGGEVGVVWKRCQVCGLAFSCQSALGLHQTVHGPDDSSGRKRRSQEQRTRPPASIQPPDWSRHRRHVSRKPWRRVGSQRLRSPQEERGGGGRSTAEEEQERRGGGERSTAEEEQERGGGGGRSTGEEEQERGGRGRSTGEEEQERGGGERSTAEEEQKEEGRERSCAGEEKENRGTCLRPRRRRVGPPIRYLLESEELSHDRTPANQGGASVCKGSTAPQKKSSAGGGALELTDMCHTTETQKTRPPAHISTPDWLECSRKRQRRSAQEKEQQEETGEGRSRAGEEEQQEEVLRPRRRMVGPPIRYLLQSEELSHDRTPANQGGARVCGGGTAPQKKSSAGGGALAVTGMCNTTDTQKTRPPAHIKTPDWLECSRKRQRRSAEEKEQQEEVLRPRRRRVGPPIRYLLQSEELSHGLTPANQNRASVCKGGTAPQKKSDAGGGASAVTDSCDITEIKKSRPFVHIKASDWLVCSRKCDGGRSRGRQRRREEEEQEGGAEEEEASLLRSRRRMVGPPIRYLLESEELSHDWTPANQNGASVCKGGTAPQKKKSSAVGGASDRCGSAERQKTRPFVPVKAPDWPGCSMKCDGGSRWRSQRRGAEEVKKVPTEEKGAAEEERGGAAEEERGGAEEEEEESLLRSRRRMVRPPIRYLLESEELSHDRTKEAQHHRRRATLGAGPQRAVS